MENNRLLGLVKNSLVIALLLLSSLLGAQEYYLKKDETGSRIFQRLAWKADENAMRYEVVIEKSAVKTASVFIEIFRDFTGESSIEVSLSPGFYRYQVIAHDFLDRPGIPSEWASLTILEAQVPELLEFSPDIFYLDNKPPWVLAVKGRNVIEGAEISLQPQGKGKVIVPTEYTIFDSSSLPNLAEGSLSKEDAAADSLSEAEAEAEAENEGEAIVEAEVQPEIKPELKHIEQPNEQFQQVYLFFDEKQLAEGKYQLVIKNPGGFEASGDPFEIKIKCKFTYFFKRLFRRKAK